MSCSERWLLCLIVTTIFVEKSSSVIILPRLQYGELNTNNGTQSGFIEIASNTSLRSLLKYKETLKERIDNVFVENLIWNILNGLSGGDFVSKVFHYEYNLKFLSKFFDFRS